MKKLLAIILCLSLMMSIIPTNALAAEAVEADYEAQQTDTEPVEEVREDIDETAGPDEEEQPADPAQEEPAPAEVEEQEPESTPADADAQLDVPVASEKAEAEPEVAVEPEPVDHKASLETEQKAADTQSDVVYTDIALNQQVDVVIDEDNDTAYFRFVPVKTGEYIFYSTSDNDPFATLYDENMELLESDDDGGSDYNFSIFCQLEGGKTYYLVASLVSGSAGTFTVTILENPIQSLSVRDVTKFEGDVESSWYWDEETEEDIEFQCYNAYPEYIVVETAKGTFEGDPSSVLEELNKAFEDANFEKGYWESDQTPDHVWDIGDHTASFHFAGRTAEYTVTILENPIQSLSVRDVTKFEGDVESSWYWDEETEEDIEFQWYNAYPEYIVVETAKGTFEGDPWSVLEELNEAFEDANFEDGYWESDQTPDHVWDIGDHTASFHFAGRTAEYTVTILENPIQSLSVRDVTKFEGDVESSWYWDEETEEDIEFQCYNAYPEYIVVETAKGTFEGDPSSVLEELNKAFEDANFEDGYWESDQTPDHVWDIGDHTASFHFAGWTAEYTVTILEKYILSVYASDIERYAGETTTEWIRDEETGEVISYQSYDVTPDYIVVETTEGTFEGTLYEVLDQIIEHFDSIPDFYTDSNQSPDNLWDVGEHAAILCIDGVPALYTVHVVENDVILSVQAEDITIYEGNTYEVGDQIDEEWVEWTEFDITPNCITVVTTEGNFTGSIDDVRQQIYDELGYDFNIFCRSDQSYYNQWSVGATHTASIIVGGVSGDYNVTIEASGLNFYDLTLFCGESETLSTDTDVDVLWVCDDEEIATVSEDGVVTAVKPGTAYVYAFGENGLYGACRVRVLFSDVAKTSQYFYEPVYWALDSGITVGYGGVDLFSPNSPCTREQIVTFLWRLMGCPEPETHASFTDVRPSAYYYDAVSWAAENGITVGLNDGTGRFGVGQACTREMCVTFLYRAVGEPEVYADEDTTFTDVKQGRYFYDSVTWAAQNDITVGLNDGTGRFGVGQTCTRAMIVTFLYRFYNNV